MLTLLVKGLGEGHLPALKCLDLYMYDTTLTEERMRVLGDALGRGCFRGVEQLTLRGCMRGAASMAPIVRGLQEGQFDRLVELRICETSTSPKWSLVSEFLSAIEPARFPRLCVLQLGSSARDKSVIAQVLARKQMTWLEAY